MDEFHIIYEQPLNELIRVSLRFEYLFNQIDSCLNVVDAERHVHTAVKLIVDLINLSDRPDLKSKISKEFNRYIMFFSRLQSSPEIQKETLNNTLQQLNELNNYFLNTQGKIAQELRNSDFFILLRQNIITPGGGSSMDTPQYFYWRNKTSQVHKEQIAIWLQAFEKIRAATKLLLNIVRNSSSPEAHIAQSGFYHENLDSQANCQLIRMALAKEIIVYPEVSLGKHRLVIRFVIPSLTARPIQTKEDVKFSLMKCII